MGSWVNLNPIFNGVADEQEIEPGSQIWVQGGLHAYSGTTGGHPAYGWRHHHKLEGFNIKIQKPDGRFEDSWVTGEHWVKAVTACYGHRRTYYNNAPARQGTYEKGGRPVGWLPEDDRDMPDGKTKYGTVEKPVMVSGPDILHFHIGPLIAVYDTPGYFIQAQGSTVPANLVAKAMIDELFESLIGMFYLTETKFNPLPSFADRGYACLLKATAEVVSRGLGSTNDTPRLHQYLDQVVLKFYETAPGHSNLAKGSPMPGVPHFQLYNGLFWLLPSMYDVYQLVEKTAPTNPITARFKAIVERLSQWMLDLETVMPGKGGRIASVCIADKEFLAGDGGKPWHSWAKFLRPEYIFGYGEKPGQTDWSPWGLRAQLVAAKVLNSSLLLDAAESTIQRLKSDQKQDHRAWLVGADGQYI